MGLNCKSGVSHLLDFRTNNLSRVFRCMSDSVFEIKLRIKVIQYISLLNNITIIKTVDTNISVTKTIILLIQNRYKFHTVLSQQQRDKNV
jgi:hypothetical protein